MNPVEQAKNEAKSRIFRKQFEHPIIRKAMGHSVRQEAAKTARYKKNAKDFSSVKTLRLLSKVNNKNLPGDVENYIKTMIIEERAGRKRPKKTKSKKTKSRKTKSKRRKNKKTSKR